MHSICLFFPTSLILSSGKKSWKWNERTPAEISIQDSTRPIYYNYRPTGFFRANGKQPDFQPISARNFLEGREGGVLIPFLRKLFFSNPSSNPTIPACVAQIEIPFPFFYCLICHESQFQCTKSHFPASKKGESAPILPLHDPLLRTVFYMF